MTLRPAYCPHCLIDVFTNEEVPPLTVKWTDPPLAATITAECSCGVNSTWALDPLSGQSTLRSHVRVRAPFVLGQYPSSVLTVDSMTAMAQQLAQQAAAHLDAQILRVCGVPIQILTDPAMAKDALKFYYRSSLPVEGVVRDSTLFLLNNIVA